MNRSVSYRLAEWTFKPGSACLVGDQESRQLTPQLNRMLVALIEADEQTLSRDALIRAVWHGRIVTDDAITRAISELRKVLRTDKFPKPVRTLHGFGYKLNIPFSILVPPRRMPVVVAAVLTGLAVVATTLFFRFGDRSPLIEKPVVTSTAFANLDAVNRYLPVAERLIYVAPEADGESLRFEQAGTTHTLLNNHRFGKMEASPSALEVAYIDLTDGCEVRTVALIDGSGRSIVGCYSKASQALAWTPDGHLLFGQQTGSRINLYAFLGDTPRITTIDSTDCISLGHIARTTEGRLLFSCALNRGDALYEVIDGRAVELFRFRSISKFAIDDDGTIYMLHTPRWKSGITRYRSPEEFTFLRTGWTLDLAIRDSRLILFRDLENFDLIRVDPETEAFVPVEGGQVHTQAFALDDSGSLWQLDDRAGRLAIYRNDQLVPAFDSDALGINFANVHCLNVTTSDRVVEFLWSAREGTNIKSAFELQSGALLDNQTVSSTTSCESPEPLPAEVVANWDDADGEPVQWRFDRDAGHLFLLVKKSSYRDIALLEFDASL